MILVSYSLVTASKRDNEQDLWLSYMITAMYSLVAASKRDWELVPPESRTRASIGAILHGVKRERTMGCTLAILCTHNSSGMWYARVVCIDYCVAFWYGFI